MSEGLNRSGVRKYFKPFPMVTIAIVAIGVVLLFAGLILPGVIIAAVGALWIAVFFAGRASEADIDRIIHSDIEAAKKASLLKVSIDEESLVAKSLTIVSPELDETGFCIKRGGDNKIRYSPMRITILHLAANQLLSYQAILDISSGNRLREATDEYFYKDIVSVSTVTQDFQYKKKDGSQGTYKNAEIFKLTTSGGTSITSFLRSSELVKEVGGEIPIGEAEQTVAAVRAMLREKKIA